MMDISLLLTEAAVIKNEVMMLILIAARAFAQGIDGSPSILNPAGPFAESIAQLWWLMLLLGTLIFLLVLFLMVGSLFKGRQEPPRSEERRVGKEC